MRFWGQLLRKFLRGTQGRPDLCFGGFSNFARKVCGPVWSTWGTALGEDKLGARATIFTTKVVRRARAGETFPHTLAFYPSLNRSLICFSSNTPPLKPSLLHPLPHTPPS